MRLELSQFTDAEIDAELFRREREHGNGKSLVVSGEPYAVPLAEFLATPQQGAEPLIGSEEDCLLPAGGLLILVGKGGKGKTTFSIDAMLHLATGMRWLGMEVRRPLRILIIENEGPREPFRRKLARRCESWEEDLGGEIFVKTLNWGACTLADSRERLELASFCQENQIDLVVGDPLDSLGMEGVGSPADTRAFMAFLIECGLTRNVAFWLLHHPNKGEHEDELDEASGAWGGKPDTMLRLAKQADGRSRLSFPKVRWGADSNKAALILGFDSDSESFSVIGTEEDSEERDFVEEIAAYVAANPNHTSREIGEEIHTHRKKVEEALGKHPDRFFGFSGSQIGRHANATCWRLV